MYHGNVANMINIFYSSMNDSLQELEGGKPSVARGKQMSAKAARVDTGLDVCTIRYKISKETFLLAHLGPAMYHGNVANMIHIFYSSLNEDSLQELRRRQAQSGQREAGGLAR